MIMAPANIHPGIFRGRTVLACEHQSIAPSDQFKTIGIKENFVANYKLKHREHASISFRKIRYESRKQLVYFNRQNVNSLPSCHHCVNIWFSIPTRVPHFQPLIFCKDHRDKTEVPDPLGLKLKDLISYKLNNNEN